MKVSFLLPVARESYRKVIESWTERTSDATVEFLISYDRDTMDPPKNAKTHSIPDGNIVSVWNDLAQQATGDLIVVIADDFYCATEDWTQYIPPMDAPKIYYGDDGIQGQQLPTHPIYTRQAYAIVGYVFPPAYKAWYTDNELKTVAGAVGMLEYLPDLKCEHRHWVNDHADKDWTYQKGESTAEAGRRRYNDRLKNGQMQAEVDRIWKALHEEDT